MEITNQQIKDLFTIKNMLAVTTVGGKPGDKVYFKNNGTQVQAVCLGNLPSGHAIAILTDKGNWYLLGEQSQTQFTNAKRTIEYRQCRNPRVVARSPGFIMWLDCDWLDSGTSTNKDFFSVIIKYFLGKSKKIFTMIPDTRSYIGSVIFGLIGEGVFPPLGYASEVLKSQKIQIIPVDLKLPGAINKIKGPFFIPLMTPSSILSPNEVLILKKVAHKYGVISCGEWEIWTTYDNLMLGNFGLERIKVLNQHGGNSYRTNNNKLASKLPNALLNNGTTGIFSEAKKSEIVTQTVTGQVTMILVDSRDLPP